jgi:hypothetical protein
MSPTETLEKNIVSPHTLQMISGYVRCISRYCGAKPKGVGPRHAPGLLVIVDNVDTLMELLNRSRCARWVYLV